MVIFRSSRSLASFMNILLTGYGVTDFGHSLARTVRNLASMVNSARWLLCRVTPVDARATAERT